ncbi:MAG TPA: methylmalonyl-CoA epimerase [Thermoanaerobaculia bacterium]|nr:methylmalonyl-CoA epimerase [Thermoanaerobaculia bacterium]HUM31018.1 methylmalonyl-CoA epimerase [Thermoanaerobaculia bacterium]HXK69316.1 methylmalonyl-CoA epimerase [Thermoanaerobaculia bacterium]
MIDHIGVAVRDAKQALATYEALGFVVEGEEDVVSQGVHVVFIQMGNTHVELLQPLNDESPIARFLVKRGEGLHHICIRVDSVRSAMESLRSIGKRLIYDEPVAGAGGRMTNFVHPADNSGVLTEIQESHASGN